MLNNYFSNFESVKLQINSPDLNNLTIISIFFILTIISLKRVIPTTLLDISQTNQMKGISIILILLGHLWIHVSQYLPSIIFSYDSVYLFLLLSGYGLTISSENRILHFKDFFKRRIIKVMIPYWAATIIIIFLDLMLLNKAYSYKNILATFIGINLSEATQYIDYTRWYITFQLFWYFVFFVINKKFSFLKSLSLLIIYAIIGALFLRITGLGNGYELGFPVGCLIGKHYSRLKDSFEKKTNFFVLAGIIFLFLVTFYKMSNVYDYLKNFEFSNIIIKAIRFAAIKGMSNLFYIFFCFSFIIIMGAIGKKGYMSKFLDFYGTISYELFLLHGCLLIKYNFIFPLLNEQLIFISFCFYFFVITLISFLFHKINNYILTNLNRAIQ